jgi:hypothetical protein
MRITAAELRDVFLCEVRCERFFSPCAIICECASACLARASVWIDDDPSPPLAGSSWLAEQEMGAFAGTAHLFLMSAMS